MLLNWDTETKELVDYISIDSPHTKNCYLTKPERQTRNELIYKTIRLSHRIYNKIEYILKSGSYIGLLEKRLNLKFFLVITSYYVLLLHAILHDAYVRVYDICNLGCAYWFELKHSILGHFLLFRRCLSKDFCKNDIFEGRSMTKCYDIKKWATLNLIKIIQMYF